MIFTETELRGAFMIELEPMGDKRGFFSRTFCCHQFERHGLNPNVAQCNISFNQHKGTLRGLHYQVAPKAEAKLIYCTRGSIYDVIIDLRPDSSTYCRWIAVELTPDNNRMLYVPEGFAHGLQTLKDDTRVFYQVTECYAPAYEKGVRWNDALFNIRWPISDPILSDKDRTFPDFDSGNK